jgi:hypothetical protein
MRHYAFFGNYTKKDKTYSVWHLTDFKVAVRYNSGHSFEIRARFPASPFVKYWTLLVS